MMLSDVCLSDVCLSDICLSRTSGLSREQRGRPRKTKIGTAHVTRDSDTTFKVNRSRSPGHYTHRGVNASGSTVSVGTYWPWEPTATLRSALCRRGGLGGSRRFGAHRGRRGGAGAYCGSRPPIQLVILLTSEGFYFKSVIRGLFTVRLSNRQMGWLVAGHKKWPMSISALPSSSTAEMNYCQPMAAFTGETV